MKTICSTILLMISVFALQAQDAGNSIVYEWQSKAGGLHALISFNAGTSNTKNKTVFYFFSMQDSLAEPLNDSCTHAIFSSLPASSVGVHILLDRSKDSTGSTDFVTLAQLVATQLLPQVKEKYSYLHADNMILAGINEAAVIVLATAMLAPEKYTKTALFFNDYAPGFAMSTQFDSLAYKLKGKLYLQAVQNNNQFNTVDYLANVIALKSSVMLFKTDLEAGQAYQVNFREGYNWLIANGNNFIIDTDY